MSPNGFRALVLPVLGACLVLRSGNAHAAWPHDPNNGNVAVCTATNHQIIPTIAPDGAGGAFIAWQDLRSGAYDTYAQRLGADGTPAWAADGVAVCSAAGNQTTVVIASDDAGGAILAWCDRRGASNDIYVQRVDRNGVPQWTANGVAVCTAAQDQLYPSIAADGFGGALVTWTDFRAGNYDIYVQRVNAAGVPQWTPDGVPVCAATNTQDYSIVVPDGTGGAIVGWEDYRNGSNFDVYAQRVSAAGFVQWAVNGAALCTAAGTQAFPKFIADGSGGAIATWYDYRAPNAHIYAQRVSASGATLWATDGAAVCTAAGDQYNSILASDGAGGAIITWNDGRTSVNWDIYAQRMGAGGAALWTANGVPLSTAAGDQLNPNIIADGNGGAIVVWGDYRNSSTSDLYAQRVSANGVAAWAANGAALSTAAGSQIVPVLATDGAGGAIVTWYDQRNGPTYDIYAQRVERFGYLGDPAPAMASVRDVPNDQGGQVKLSWYPSYLDPLSDPNLASYDIYRSVPGSIASDAVKLGARLYTSFADAPRAGERSFVMDPAHSQLYAWQYVGSTTPAHFLSAYGYLAATTGDSIAGSNPPTVFMVVARNASSSMYWLSPPDSGYSVDNLAPAAPAPFTGTWTSGTVALHWDPSSASDFASYHLYRGSSPGFVPGPSNQIATLPDTGYVDPAGAPYYYKLSAVDAHGNESGFALYTPIGTADAPHGDRPASVRLAPPQPNPAVRTALIACDLPRRAPIELVVHDASGRVVRTLASGVREAGRFTVPWDLRDQTDRRVAAGVYFVRLVTPGASITRRIAVTR